MGKKSVLFLVLFSFLFPVFMAEMVQAEEYYWPDLEYWKNYTGHTSELIASPFQWGRQEWITAGAVSGTTLFLLAIDEPVRNWVQKNRNPLSDQVSEWANPWGCGRQRLLPLTGGIYLLGLITEKQDLQKTGLWATQSFFLAGFFSEIVKTTFQRHRPREGKGAFLFDGPSWPRENESFASGHACVAFAVATVVAEKLDTYPLVSEASYVLASLVGLSRINDDGHWASDVFLGSAIGYFTAQGVLELNQREDNDAHALMPVYRDGDLGIAYNFSF